jgi:hypothetical protein
LVSTSPYKRTGTTVVESNRGELDLLEPVVGHCEAVALFYGFAWNIVEGPHALVGAGRRRCQRTRKRDQQKKGEELIRLHGKSSLMSSVSDSDMISSGQKRLIPAEK